MKRTLAALLDVYRRSPRWTAWAPATRLRNARVLEDFVRDNPGWLVASIRRGDMVRARDSIGAAAPDAANNWLKAVRGLMGYAVEIEWIAADPCASIKPLPSRRPGGHRTWTEDEIDRFLAHHRPGTVAHTALTLMLWTAASRADVVRLGWQNVRGDRIEYRRQKMQSRGGELVSVRIMPQLAALLDRLPRDRLTFLETRDGRARSAKSLTGDMAAWVKAAGLGAPDEHDRGLSCHGLRKAMGVRLAQAGATEHEIAAWLGHGSTKSVQVYTRAYARDAAADRAAEKLGSAPLERTKIVRLPQPRKKLPNPLKE